MAFRTTWNTSYEATPPDSQAKSQGAQRIRELKQDIRERLEIDHIFGGMDDVDSGKHKQVTLKQLANAPATESDEVALYSKDVSGSPELFYRPKSSGAEVQLTSAGKLALAGTILPVGCILDYIANTPPAGWLLCYGQAISRTTYADLFAVIGTTFGVGDGSTTFNLPDFRGRVGIGRDDMGGSAANRVTSGGSGINGVSLGASGGVEAVTLTAAQSGLPAHSVSVPSLFLFGGSNQIGGTGYPATPNGTRTVNISAQNASQAHSNMPPAIVINKIIFTGVFA